MTSVTLCQGWYFEGPEDYCMLNHSILRMHFQSLGYSGTYHLKGTCDNLKTSAVFDGLQSPLNRNIFPFSNRKDRE